MKASDLAWAALFAALAFVPDEKLVRHKLLALELGSALMLAAGLLSRTWRRGRLDLPVALYALSAPAFYLLSPEPKNSELELTRVLFCAVAYFAATQTSSPRVLKPWAGAAALASVWALRQGLDRPFGTFGNPIFLGTFLAASLALTAALAVSETGRARLALWACAAVQAAGLWAAQSRAAFAGLLAAALLWALSRLDGKRRWAALGLLAAGGAVLVWHFRERAWTHGLIWRDTLNLWLARPLLGCGLGRFHLEFPAYASEALKALWPQGQVIVNFAHNEYLQVLAETGIVGFGLFLAVPLGLLKVPMSPAWLAAAALFAAAFFSPDLRLSVSPFVAFAALGIAARTEEIRPLKPLVLVLALLGLGAWGRLALVPYLAQRRLAAQPQFHVEATAAARREIEALERRLAEDSGNADLAEKLGYLYAKERSWTGAVSRYELAAKLAPGRPGPYNNLGNIAYTLGDLDKAVAYWEKSLSVAPDQLDARLNLGKLLYERGRLKEAAAHLQKALELDPGNEKARVMLKKMVE